MWLNIHMRPAGLMAHLLKYLQYVHRESDKLQSHVAEVMTCVSDIFVGGRANKSQNGAFSHFILSSFNKITQDACGGLAQRG